MAPRCSLAPSHGSSSFSRNRFQIVRHHVAGDAAPGRDSTIRAVPPVPHRLHTVHDGDDLEDRPRSPSEVPGTAVFMTAQPTGTPPALVHNRHNTVLHKRVVVLTVATAQVPTCAAERAAVDSIARA
jgi:hypothetical protein